MSPEQNQAQGQQAGHPWSEICCFNFLNFFNFKNIFIDLQLIYNSVLISKSLAFLTSSKISTLLCVLFAAQHFSQSPFTYIPRRPVHSSLGRGAQCTSSREMESKELSEGTRTMITLPLLSTLKKGKTTSHRHPAGTDHGLCPSAISPGV